MADRPVPENGEIEITPEMIEAGVATYAAVDRRFEGIDDAVKRIYREMARSSNKPVIQYG